MTLKMYRFDDDTVIAESPEDATEIMIAETGENPEDMYYLTEDWEEVPGDKELMMIYGDDPTDPEAETVLKSVDQWIVDKGRGYFGYSGG